MPFIQSFLTCQRKALNNYLSVFRISLTILIFSAPLYSCGIVSWHSIEQVPAQPVAYIRDGVFVSGEYIRSVSIAEIDAKAVTKSNNNLIEIALGKHRVKIYCDEATGEFNSLEFSGRAKTLEFEAQLQRTYLVRCEPYSHWWIEDLESKHVVAGDKF